MPESYNDNELRLHVLRVRALSGLHEPGEITGAIDAGLSLFRFVREGIFVYLYLGIEKDLKVKPEVKHAFSQYSSSAPIKLTNMYPRSFDRELKKCLISLEPSGWNPPPRKLMLQGHLMYLRVVTLEKEAFHITCHEDGFYVNQSTNEKFDPSIRDDRNYQNQHSLFILLEKVSAKFKAVLKILIEERNKKEIPERHQVSSSWIPSFPWLVHDVPQHTYDPCRNAEAFLRFGVDRADGLHDWNEDFQSYRELPRGSVHERMLRDQLFYKVYNEHSNAAIQGAMQVVEGGVQPLNPGENNDLQLYMQNSIFFSNGYDQEMYKDLGGEAAAHAAASKDLLGVNIVTELDLEGICTLGTTLVDYKGNRIMCQTIVPGIFRPEENLIVYGTLDSGKRIVAEKDFHEKISSLAKAWNYAEHNVLSHQDNEMKKIYLSKDCKGLKATDGRFYLLDLSRMMPVDIEWLEQDFSHNDEFPEYPHRITLLRPELWKRFVEYRSHEYIKEQTLIALDQKKKEMGDKTEEEQKEMQINLNELRINMENFSVPLNTDCFLLPAEESGEEMREHEAVVREASKFLREQVIPAFVSLNYSLKLIRFRLPKPPAPAR